MKPGFYTVRKGKNKLILASRCQHSKEAAESWADFMDDDEPRNAPHFVIEVHPR